MANKVISIPPDVSELDMQQRIVPLEYGRWPARTGWGGPPAGFAGEDHTELLAALASSSRAARGALRGVLVGAAFYGTILLLLGVIKL